MVTCIKMIIIIIITIIIIRLRVAEDTNRKFQSEVHDLQHKVNQLERDLYDERQANKAPREQLSKLQSQMGAVDGKNEELQRRLVQILIYKDPSIEAWRN